MQEDNSEKRMERFLFNIDDKISDIRNILYDINSKLCYVIRRKKDHYDIYHDMTQGDDSYGNLNER